MGNRDETQPEGVMDARRRMGPGEGLSDDVSGHGMPEVPGAGEGFASPRLPRGDRLARDAEDDVEGHAFGSRASGLAIDDDAAPSPATDEATSA
jgi:hypothetical protein